jgi:hypothetical protein
MSCDICYVLLRCDDDKPQVASFFEKLSNKLENFFAKIPKSKWMKGLVQRSFYMGT